MAKPEGTPEGKGVYLTVYPSSRPNTDTVYPSSHHNTDTVHFIPIQSTGKPAVFPGLSDLLLGQADQIKSGINVSHGYQLPRSRRTSLPTNKNLTSNLRSL